MLLFEILAVVVILAFIANGYKAGAIETLGRVLGSLVGFLIAKLYSAWFVSILAFLLPLQWAHLIAFIVVFLIVDYVIGLLFKFAGDLLKIFTKLPIIKQINNLLGLVLGYAEAMIVIGGVSWLMQQTAAIGFSTVTSLSVVRFAEKQFEYIFSFLL